MTLPTNYSKTNLGRIVAIDYGMKRTGLAITDPLKIIASALKTVQTKELLSFLKVYSKKEEVDKWVVGLPKKLNGESAEIEPYIKQFIGQINRAFPAIPVVRVDERFTSQIARRAMVEGKMKKKDRRKKGNIDKISAVLILQSYLDS